MRVRNPCKSGGDFRGEVHTEVWSFEHHIWHLREGEVTRVRQDEHGTGEVAAQRCCDSTLHYI